MLQVKFDCDRPAGLRDIHGEQKDPHTDTNSMGLLWVKLTLCAFGSVELKMPPNC